MHSPIPAGECWGKLTPRRGEPERWHPLSDHCMDVVACAEARFSGALQEHREKQRQQLTAPGESKREARRVELALRPPACERTARDSQDSEIAGAAHSATLEPHAR